MEIQERANSKYSPSLIARTIHLKNFLPMKSDVLEIGCGEGYITIELIKRKNKIEAFDYSKEAVKKAKNYTRDKAKFFVKKFHNFKPGKKYDCVIFTEVIEHLKGNPLHSLKKIHSWLKPNGILVLSTIIEKDNNPYHFKIYSEEKIKNLVEKTGFKILREKKWGSLTREYIHKNISNIDNKIPFYYHFKKILIPIIKLESLLGFAKNEGIILKCQKI